MKISAVAFAAIAVATGTVSAQKPTDEGIAVGDMICTYGYIMDEFCLDRGATLDTNHDPLVDPDKHTLHCLLDVDPCVGSPFHILLDPSESEGEALYTDGWVAESNDMLVEVGLSLGSVELGCTECTEGQGVLEAGFRAQVKGTVVTLDPPVLAISDVMPLAGDEMGCMMMDDPTMEDPMKAALERIEAKLDMLLAKECPQMGMTDGNGGEETAVEAEEDPDGGDM